MLKTFVCLSVLLLSLGVGIYPSAGAGTIDPCGDRNDCIGLVLILRCGNGAQPDIDQHFTILLLDTATGGQFEYSLSLSHVYPAEVWYIAAAGALDTSHEYRTHLIRDGVYIGDWSPAYSPPAVVGYTYDLPDCPFRVFLPQVRK